MQHKHLTYSFIWHVVRPPSQSFSCNIPLYFLFHFTCYSTIETVIPWYTTLFLFCLTCYSSINIVLFHGMQPSYKLLYLTCYCIIILLSFHAIHHFYFLCLFDLWLEHYHSVTSFYTSFLFASWFVLLESSCFFLYLIKLSDHYVSFKVCNSLTYIHIWPVVAVL